MSKTVIVEEIPAEKFNAFVAMENSTLHELSLYKCERHGAKPIERIWYSLDCRMKMASEVTAVEELAKLRWQLSFELLAFESACREAFERSPDLEKQTVWIAVDPVKLGQNVSYESYCQHRITKTQSAIEDIAELLRECHQSP